MKKNCSTTHSLKFVFIALLGINIIACEKKPKSTAEESEITIDKSKILIQSKEIVEEAKTVSTKHDERDAIFLTEATEINLEQIDFGIKSIMV